MEQYTGRGWGVVWAWVRRRTLMVGVSVCLCVVPAVDAVADAAATVDPGVDPGVDPVGPRFARVGLIWENDTAPLKPNRNTDRYYTNGLEAYGAWQPGGELRRGLLDFLDALPGIPGSSDDGDRVGVALVFSLTQAMYTPSNIENPDPPRDDHPYAGHLFGGVALQRSKPLGGPAAAKGRETEPRVFDQIRFDLGWVGEGSGAEVVQERIHEWINARTPSAWTDQLGNEPTFQFTLTRKWRLPLPGGSGSQGGFGHQVIPAVMLGLGTVRVDARAGVMYRVGWGLPDDFGPGFIGDTADFTSMGRGPGRGWLGGVYGFVSASGRAVAHDLFIAGGTLSDADVSDLDLEPVVGDASLGVALNLFRGEQVAFDVAYAQTFETRRFSSQRSHTHEIGRLNLSATWRF